MSREKVLGAEEKEEEDDDDDDDDDEDDEENGVTGKSKFDPFPISPPLFFRIPGKKNSHLRYSQTATPLRATLLELLTAAS